MPTCDYCPSDALWLAAAESATAGMTRLACRAHVDRARRHCSAVGVPTITAVPARSASQPKRTAAMPNQTTATQAAEICGEVGTSFTTDHEPHYTDPCQLPADHDELHDWAQREAAREPTPAKAAEAANQQIANIKTHFTRRTDTLKARAERAEAERDQLVLDLEDMRHVARGNMRHVTTLTGLLDTVEQLATTWTSRPGTPEHDCGSDILHAINGGAGAASVPPRRAQEPGRAYVATLTALLEAVRDLTRDTDGDDLDPGSEIPVGEIQRVLNEPIPGTAPVPGSSHRAPEPTERLTATTIRVAIRAGLDAYPNSLSEGMDAAAVTVARLLDQDPKSRPRSAR